MILIEYENGVLTVTAGQPENITLYFTAKDECAFATFSLPNGGTETRKFPLADLDYSLTIEISGRLRVATNLKGLPLEIEEG